LQLDLFSVLSGAGICDDEAIIDIAAQLSSPPDEDT
jgi:hypothetical protein